MLERPRMFNGKTLIYLLLAGSFFTTVAMADWNLHERCLNRGPKGDVDSCRNAILQDPMNVKLITAYGEGLFYQREYDAALRVFQQVTEMIPGQASSHYRLGAALAALRRWEPALPPLQKAISIEPNLLAAHEILAVAYQVLHRDLDAFAANRNAAELGSVTAMATLAYDYEHGRGIPKDEVKAEKWLHRAADHSHVGSMKRLVAIYRHGSLGVAIDPDEADRWIDRIDDIIN